MPWLLAVLAVSAAGWGGDGHSSSGTRLTFITTEGYNGAETDLVGTPTSVATGSGQVTVSLTDGSRTLNATVPLASVAPGQTVAATDAGVDIRYAETISGGTDLRRWEATPGTVTYTRIGGGTLDARIEGLTFTPIQENSGDVAAGPFAANGRIVRAPVAFTM